MREETAKGNSNSSCTNTVLIHETYQKRGTVTLVSNGTEGAEIFSVEKRFLLIYVLEFWISGNVLLLLFFFFLLKREFR